MKRLGTFLGLALIAVGAVGAARAAYDPLKAQLGQWLLDRAWADTQSGNPTRPWDWADITPVARISVPRLGVSAVVLGSASGEAMAWGPGHISGTASPGKPGLSAIAGHRDTHLAFLAETKPGDEVFVETANGLTHRYVVREGLVVDSRHWTLPTRTDGPEKLVLVTCWPFDANFQGPLRFVLYAEPA
ncbi:MAG: class GN sortase [Pseudomonadota bacterium]